LSYGLPPGSGILDWEEIIKALRSVGYVGFLSFEMTRYEDPAKYAKVGLDYLQKLLDR
jgi:sugar phosphate isomerase/epimerase